MAQLIVRQLEDEVVARLRRRAARRGVSAEEEHRRILRSALSDGDRGTPRTFKEHLAAMPAVGDDKLFARTRSKARRVRF